MTNIKISELEETNYLQGGCCFPLVQEDETKKVSFETLKNEIPKTEVMIGATTTGEAGTDATVFNSGTPSNPILNFTIPKGDKGDRGIKGDKGEQGPKGDPGEVSQSEFDELQDEVNDLYKNQIKGSGTGTTIQATDCAEMKTEIILFGKTTQNTTSGKNLLPNNATTQTIDGVTFTVNDDRTILVNGTNTGTSSIRYTIYKDDSMSTIINAGDYILSNSISGSVPDGVNLALTLYPVGGGSSYSPHCSNNETTLNYAKDLKLYMARIDIPSGTTVDNLLFKPMLRLASITDSTYEPYTNGPTPNPDYKQDIVNITGDDDGCITETISNSSNQNSLEIDLLNNELCSNKNLSVKDEVYFQNGHVYLKKNIGKVVLDGSEDWVLWAAGLDDVERYYVNLDSNVVLSANTLCDRFKYDDSNANREHFRNSTHQGKPTQFVIFINKTRVNNENELKAWLSTHNTIVQYEVATPQIIDLGEYAPLKTFKGDCTITNSEDTNMSLVYYKDLEKIINNLTTKVNSMKEVNE